MIPSLLRALTLATVSSSLAACSLLLAGDDLSSGPATTGSGDLSAPVETGEDPVGSDSATTEAGRAHDGDGDEGAPIRIDVPLRFTSPNGATFTTTDAGTTITGFTSPNERAVILPSPQPAIPSEDYTVEATVRAPSNAAFGILARVQPGGGAAAAFGPLPESGGKAIAFQHLRAYTSFNGGYTEQSIGSGYAFTANARYRLKLRVTGQQATAKIWKPPQAEPGFQTVISAPWSTGRAIGFFVGDHYDVVLESLTVTVP